MVVSCFAFPYFTYVCMHRPREDYAKFQVPKGSSKAVHEALTWKFKILFKKKFGKMLGLKFIFLHHLQLKSI